MVEKPMKMCVKN